jgi:hypothetical protein
MGRCIGAARAEHRSIVLGRSPQVAPALRAITHCEILYETKVGNQTTLCSPTVVEPKTC